jgi:hypothetical protein
MKVASIGGNYYVSTVIDEFSRRIHGDIIKSKSGAAIKIIQLIKQCQTQTGKALKEENTELRH